METELIEQGLSLMLVGMGTVFAFLTALVFAMNAMSRFASFVDSRSAEDGPTAEEVAAIGAAIARHRKS